MRISTIRSLAIGISILAFSTAKIGLAQNPGSPIPGVAPFGTLSFDEKGTSLLNNGPNPNPVNLVAGGGIDFFLPLPVTPGQVLIVNPNDANTAFPNGDSDLLTFSNVLNPNGTPAFGVMRYESLIPTDAYDMTTLDPADVQRLNYLAPILTITENGPEGLNNFTYTAGLNTYFGWSDGYLPTPEPSTFVLCALGLFGLLALAYRRRCARIC